MEDQTGEFNPEEDKIQKLLLKVDTLVVCSGAYGTTEQSLKGTASWSTQTRKASITNQALHSHVHAARATLETFRTEHCYFIICFVF